MEIVHLTKTEFLNKVYNYEANPNDWKYEGDKPCIVDFYATWCGPCKALAPVLEELAKEYDGKIYIYKVDVDKEEELAATFGIRSIPTLLWIPKDGKPTVTQGAMPKTELKKMIDEVFKGEKIVLIENEFGEVGIDGGFLKDAGIEITEMNSGCICCSLVGDFGKNLN